ncbi:hypothetical protein QSJ18_18620 [Gordonia sp. ABSL1-1]|uniref:hypothetical protein n=1 Tax=Gordonia sp. ABSL1-1 TaxID=3053923 RepID=UPI0025733560|nr:hypothetical protein [Gordonia sp. ABSL1-1]MDL9938765.1 hypothetical protein [Gordonia sp. ABSL1-1]
MKPTPPALLTMMKVIGSQSVLPVHDDVPARRPAEFIQVSLTGGTEDRTGVLATPTFTIAVYALDQGRAEMLAGLVLALVKSSQYRVVGQVQVRGWQTTALPAPSPDPRVADRRRWTFTGSLGMSNVRH